jgi:hypothetical protein
MAAPRSKTGLLRYADGRVRPARFYYGDQEQTPPDRTQIDSTRHVLWTEDDGAVGIRQGTAVSIGATPAYSANYDALDWGN